MRKNAKIGGFAAHPKIPKSEVMRILKILITVFYTPKSEVLCIRKNSKIGGFA